MKISGSKFDLLGCCQYWARADVDAPRLPSSAAASLGTQFAELAETDGLSPANASSDARALFAAWKRSPFAASAWRHEVAFAYDPSTDTARELPQQNGHRDYSSASEREICCTLDLLRIEDGVAHVGDHKTGRQEHLRPSALNGQLAFGALCACRAHGLDAARVALYRVEPDDVLEDATDLDTFDLSDTAIRLLEMLTAIPHAGPRPGHHCSERYCPAIAICPAMAVSTEAIVAQAGSTPLVIDATTAPRLLARLEEVEAATDAVRAALRVYADASGGIAMKDGRIWRQHVESHESVDVDTVSLAVLERHGLADACETKLICAKKAIDAQLVARHPGREGAKERAAAWAACRYDLQQADRLKTASVTKYRAWK